MENSAVIGEVRGSAAHYFSFQIYIVGHLPF